MKILFTFLILTGILFSQNYEWAKVNPINLTTNPSYVTNSLAVDGDASIITVRLNISKEIFSQKYLGNHIFEKHDTFGNLLWQDTLSGKVSVASVKTDGLNSIIVSGIFKDTLQIDELLLTDFSDEPVGFILKFNSGGGLIWSKILNTTLPELREVKGMAVDFQNNIWVSVVNNFQDSFIKKFSPDGTELQTFFQDNVRSVSGIDIDVNGNVIVSGSAGNNAQSFNGHNVTPPHVYNMYVVKYSPAGSAQWVRFVEDVTLLDFIVKCDPSGNIFFGGNLSNAASFGTINVEGPNWVYDFFVAKMNPAGEFLWVREVPNQSPLSGDASVGNSDFLSCDNQGSVYFSGFIRGSIDWGNGIITNSVNLAEDALVLKYSGDGTLLWGKTAGSPSSDRAQTIAIDINGKCLLAGRVAANSKFDSLQYDGGSLNSFVAKLNQPAIVPVELISFTASVSNGNIILNWVTATEVNNKGFEVERNEVSDRRLAVGSEEWKVVGFVNGKGTTSEQQSYSFTDNSITNGIYSYRLKQIDFDGMFEYSNAIEGSFMKPSVFYLEQNYPNPFNPYTMIRFTVADAFYASHVQVLLRVYDVLGNEVATLINEEKSSGSYEINFDASNLSSGVYYYRLRTGNFVETKKMALLK